MKRILVLMIAVLSLTHAGGSDLIRRDVNYLASKECNGRNVQHGGIYKAESYIVQELENNGLEVLLQPVTYRLNQTFDTPICVVNGDTLRAGYDFVPHPFSASADKHYSIEEIEVIDSAALANIMEAHDLSSLSAARRYLLKKSRPKDRRKLLMFSGDYPLLSRQSKQYARPALQVEKSCLSDKIESVYMFNRSELKNVTTNNIIAKIEGTEHPDSVICISAHYDHMGSLGEVYYPGANDNASGTAVLLSLARYFSKNPPPVSLVFCFFTGEEQGLKGSWKYVKHPSVPLKNVMMALNLDMVGSGLKGYGIVAGNDHPDDISIFEDIREANGLGDLRLRHNAPNSDHFPFTAIGVPALFFYASGGEQPYHHPDDIPETLDWKAIENTVIMVKRYILSKNDSSEDQGLSR